MGSERGIGIIEELVVQLAPLLSKDSVWTLLLHPRSSTKKVPGILAPDRRTGLLSEAEAQHVRAIAQVVLVPILYDRSDDTQAVKRLLPQVKTAQIYILGVLLLPPGVECSAELNEELLVRHKELLQAGFAEVLMNPDTEPEFLRCAVEGALATWRVSTRRLYHFLDAMAPTTTTDRDLWELKATHAKLLWEDALKSLMPQFPSVDRGLRESEATVGEYNLISSLSSLDHPLMLVTDPAGKRHMLKVIDKRKVTEFTVLEGLYREYRFLSAMLEHPNVVECHRVLHSKFRFYLVFSYAGELSLTDLLMDLPGERTSPDDALHNMTQLARGVAYCHSLSVGIRRICPDAVYLDKERNSTKYTCKLVDFSCALLSKGEACSPTAYGALPCIAPEVALGDLYQPLPADVWSLGVVLLEMAGGLGSLARSVPFDSEDEAAAVSPAICHYFGQPGRHAQALATLGAVRHSGITELLAMMLQPKPTHRAPMQAVSDHCEELQSKS